jgi:phosphatidylserine/phosphatidylglycerophosphate/cardiolipin synthase-like enzyme
MTRLPGALRHRTLTEEGPQIVWEALVEVGAVSAESPVLRSGPLARLLFSVTIPGQIEGAGHATEESPQLVWTLPEATAPAMPSRRQTYLEASIRLIDESRQTLTLVSPYMDSRGIGMLFAPLMNALWRGVRTTILTHDALNPMSFTSAAIEELRRETRRSGGPLTVYSAEAGSGADRRQNPLLHAKLIVSDDRRVLVGSGNLTSFALALNLEAGTVLGPAAAAEATAVVTYLIRANLVYLVFGPDGRTSR